MSSSSGYQDLSMAAREFYSDSTDTDWTGSAAGYDDFQLTHHELEVLRLCAEAAASTGNMPNGSILEYTLDASPVSNLSSTSSSTETDTRENSVVPSDGEGLLAG
ncbi:hypothetical protein FHETE_2519 [Fusarium heterosporum]|uniref:Uncharacterized protein n=1 Tax=Fusarium heterosporum TaxID=42747 RepID=A0A8H5TTX7_FUSHE|nr:hypothetical protein FHETE_2519 [Fusarium heterosporum]